MATAKGYTPDSNESLPRVNVQLFVELMTSVLSKLGASEVKVEDVSGGIISFYQGGEMTAIPVHVRLSYQQTRLYFSFKAGTALTISKRLFLLDTEASRQQLVAEMLKIGNWQVERMSEGVKFTFRNALQADKLVKHGQHKQGTRVEPPQRTSHLQDETPLALKRPARKLQ